MSPLAHRIVKEFTLPIKDRRFNDRCGLLRLMSDIHCFDVTEVAPLMDEVRAHYADNFDERSAFLPAPRTWLESRDSKGWRTATLIEQETDDPRGWAKVYIAAGSRDYFGSHPVAIRVRISDFSSDPSGLSKDQKDTTLASIYSALVCINSPQVIGRKTRMPHASLQRRLAEQMRVVGSFPLRAWTELKLRAFATVDEGGKSQQIVLTGQRCLHWVRAHCRPSNGQLVRSYWRGDAALGIKRTRYKLAA